MWKLPRYLPAIVFTRKPLPEVAIASRPPIHPKPLSFPPPAPLGERGLRGALQREVTNHNATQVCFLGMKLGLRTLNLFAGLRIQNLFARHRIQSLIAGLRIQNLFAGFRIQTCLRDSGFKTCLRDSGSKTCLRDSGSKVSLRDSGSKSCLRDLRTKTCLILNQMSGIYWPSYINGCLKYADNHYCKLQTSN